MENLWNTYPRPQLVRERWVNLNGEWSFNGSDTINVPFCPESELSGIDKQAWDGKSLVYEREIEIPEDWQDAEHILLHFGAVDQEASVYINQELAGEHKGGYLPWCVDVAPFVRAGETATLQVVARDELNHKYPWGKQKKANGGMWYTPVSGIWQSVWAEPVPCEYIKSLKIDTGLDWVEIRAYGITAGTIEILGETHELIAEEAGEACASIRLSINRPHLWFPEDPFLYNFKITAGEDLVESYFALRTLSIEERDGYKRLCLNGESYFFNGLLDQGYWQNGIYTPESPACFERDILAMKQLGFNTLRKHIKLEHEQFYYDCDRLGMVVFQDMVNNGDYSFVHDTAMPTVGLKKMKDTDWHNDPETRQIFLESMEETVKTLYNHPSICYWTIFNEGWGQFCADAAYDRLKAMDPTRFIDSTSGWFAQERSDVDSQHVYFKPVKLKAGSKPLVLSEFGGYSCRLIAHCFKKDKNYGYRKCEDEAALLRDMAKLYNDEILPLIDKGLCAAIYTQVSDVEEETNGILTYDREVQKFKSYVGTGRVELVGNHTDHQGGMVLVTPSREKIRAYVADNHESVIRVFSEGFPDIEVSITGKAVSAEKGTSKSLVVGILSCFAESLGLPQESDDASLEGKGFDCYIKSEIGIGSGLSSSAAFEVLLARIINERFYGGRADAITIAKICQMAENLFYGKPCGLMDQLAVALGQTALLDFGHIEPEIEIVDYDFGYSNTGYEMLIADTHSSHAGRDADYAEITEDMCKVAEVLGVRKLGDISRDTFIRRYGALSEALENGTLEERQLDRARHFYDDTERALAGAVALQAGNFRKFLSCVDESGRSSELLLKNIVPSDSETCDNNLSLAIKELRKDGRVAAIKIEGGGFGGSLLVFKR